MSLLKKKLDRIWNKKPISDPLKRARWTFEMDGRGHIRVVPYPIRRTIKWNGMN